MIAEVLVPFLWASSKAEPYGRKHMVENSYSPYDDGWKAKRQRPELGFQCIANDITFSYQAPPPNVSTTSQ